jgi:molybdenum cofactor biosynthesis enzyme
MGASICIIKENTKGLVLVTNKIGLELNDKKTKFMIVMCRDQHAVQNHNIHIYVGNKSFKRMEHFKFLEYP